MKASGNCLPDNENNEEYIKFLNRQLEDIRTQLLLLADNDKLTQEKADLLRLAEKLRELRR